MNENLSWVIAVGLLSIAISSGQAATDIRAVSSIQLDYISTRRPMRG